MSIDILPSNMDLFAPRITAQASVKPWKPHALRHDQWPPDYKAVYAWRMSTLAQLRDDPDLLASAKAYYKTHKGEFIQHWMDTYNPRKQSMRWMPFVFFYRQQEFIEFLEELDRDSANGLVEKCRDVGATWLACAYSVACLILDGDDATGWGSRKENLVDTIGDTDSIFEKMRKLVERLPDIWKPLGFNERKHATFMKLLNPENGSSVTGESGDNIGRGGRKKRYFKDESAHYERPEKIEAALGDNTNVQIDISSVNGPGNIFYRRRKSGMEWGPGVVIEPGRTRVFIFDWRHHPEKTQAWYDQRRANAEREGMLYVFAQEVDRDYMSAMQNRIIDPKWVDACVDAHLHIPCLRVPPPNMWMAGLDIADQGLDTNALALRQWIILRSVDEWGERDPGVTARRAIGALCRYKGIKCQYDSIGMGVTVRSEFNRLVIDEGILSRKDIDMIPWNAGAGVIDPYEFVIPNDDQSPINKDHYHNFKAQAWFSFMRRCYKTYKARIEGAIYPADDLVSLDSNMHNLFQLKAELSQPVSKQSTTLKTMVDKLGESVKSPNMGDSVVMCYNPAPEDGELIIGGMG